MSDERHWNPGVQAVPREQRRKMLGTRLSRQLDYVYQNSEFFHERLDSVGFSPGAVSSFDEFRQLPVLFRKEDERASLAASLDRFGHPYGMHVCADIRNITYRQATSGTSGYPTWYLFTDADYRIFAEAGARYWHWCGIRRGDTVLFAMGSGMWVSAMFVSALRSMGACPVPVGLEAGVDGVLRYADLCRPKALLATPSFCRMLAEEAPNSIGKSVAELGVQQLILGGEPGAGLPGVKRQLEDAYGATVFDIIGPFWGNAYASCSAKTYQGLHCLSDDLAVWHQDLRDPVTGEPVPVVDGAVGEAVTSGGEHEAAPMLKFGSGDIVQVYTDNCECGFSGDRIRIIGRAEDMLSVEGRNFFPSDITNAVAEVGGPITGNVRIRLYSPPPVVRSPLPLLVEYGRELSTEELDQLRQAVVEQVLDQLGVACTIELVPEGRLERSATKTKIVLHEYAR